MAKSQKDKKNVAAEPEVEAALGVNMSFSASEAYKRLRTSLIFSLPKDQERGCRVVGVTSAQEKEGKSTTAYNLAYSLAESGQMTVCIEADMRLPRISKRLSLQPVPGLSECLAGEVTDGTAALRKINQNLYVMPSGSVPPNPSELLGSPTMQAVIDSLSKQFSFIIIDLPPVGAVADALTVSQVVDGMILVVRKNYVTKRQLAGVVRELQLSNARILGFVFNEATDQRVRNYKKYKRYGYGDYGYYGYYRKSSRKNTDNADKKEEKEQKADKK